MLSSITAAGLTPQNLAICAGVSVLLGLIVAFVHAKTAKYSKNFITTLVVLPLLVMGVMMMVNGNLGTGIAIMGAFSLVRFRSIPGTSREIVSVFFAMSIGLATGTGYVGFALMMTAAISLVLVLMSSLKLFQPRIASQRLIVTLPEDSEYDTALQPVFDKYGVKAELEQIRTKNMGSLLEATYDAKIPSKVNRKQFIDDLRVRNGNLAITLYSTNAEGGL